MKLSKNYIWFVFLFMIIFSPKEALAKALDKEQVIINISNSRVSFICSDGSIKEEQYENHSFFIGGDGKTYFSVDSLLNIINQGKYNFQTYSDNDIINIVWDSDIILKIDKSNLTATAYNESGKTKSFNMITDKVNIFLPLRDTMGTLGYKDNEIIYNSALKTISLNHSPLFETDKITVTDYMHGSSKEILAEQYVVYDVIDSNFTGKIISCFNETPLYNCNVTYMSLNPWYKFDFNNGVVVEIESNCVCKIYNNGEYLGQYQIPFDLSAEIEKFITRTLPENKIMHDLWWYDFSKDRISSYEYLTYDYMDDNYKEVIDYIKSQSVDFDEKYNYRIESKKENKDYFVTIVITNKNIPENQFKTSFRLYKYPGAVKKTQIDTFLYPLK